MLLWAVVVGITGAYATTMFRQGIDLLQRSFGPETTNFVEVAAQLSWQAKVGFPTIGGLVAGFCLLIARRQVAAGPVDYMEAVTVGTGVVPVGASIWRSLSSLFSIASEGSIGREGPMVRLAALCSSAIGRFMQFEPSQLRMLVACGAAAGITSAYSAPIAAAFFVTELVLGCMTMEWFGPILVSSGVANITMRALPGYHPAYQMPTFPPVTGFEVLPFVAWGLICGVVAPRFLQLVAASKTNFAKLPIPLPLRLALGGLLVGGISVWAPEVWGNGYETVNSLLHQPWTWVALTTILCLKVLATLATAGSGAVGGVFTPTLFVGAALGCLYGTAVNALWPHMETAPFAFAIVGMGAFLAAATNAPLMAILMIFEMTLSYEVILPLMLASVIAYFVAKKSEHISMYEVTVRRGRANSDRARLASLRICELLKPAETVVDLNASVDEVTRIFLRHPVKHVYIVEENQNFRGVVTTESLIAELALPVELRRKTVTEFVVTNFNLLTPDMTLSEALAMFLKFRGERLPVVEIEGETSKILGVVHKSALLDAYLRMDAASR